MGAEGVGKTAWCEFLNTFRKSAGEKEGAKGCNRSKEGEIAISNCYFTFTIRHLHNKPIIWVLNKDWKEVGTGTKLAGRCRVLKGR